MMVLAAVEYILMILHYAPVRFDKYEPIAINMRAAVKASQSTFCRTVSLSFFYGAHTSDMVMKNGNYVQNELLDISFFELIIIQPLLAHS